MGRRVLISSLEHSTLLFYLLLSFNIEAVGNDRCRTSRETSLELLRVKSLDCLSDIFFSLMYKLDKLLRLVKTIVCM